MAVESLTNPRENLPNTYTNVTAREKDFVSRFTNDWEALREAMGITRPIKKEAGTKLVSYTATVTLASGAVDPGNVIPYSKTKIEQVGHDDLTLEKFAKAVPIEDVDKYGVDVAVEKSDDAFLNELQNKVLDDFYTVIKNDTYAITGSESTFQMAVAIAIGSVRDKFKKMRKNVSSIVVFVNTMDAYRYLGQAEISIQSLFGLEYVQNIMGAQTMILSSEIDEGTVIAIPADNFVDYYIDPSTEFAKLGLVYTVDGETNLIGFHAQGNYGTAVGESFAVMGFKLWPEYADGVAIITIDANPLKGVTVTSEADDTTYPWTDQTPGDFQDDVAVTGNKVTGSLKFIEGGLAPSGYLSGDGYFLALKWTNPDAAATSLKVGLQPSAGAGMQECINDPDRNGVFKIASTAQKIVIISSNDDKKTKQVFDLTGLVLEDPSV